LLSLLKVYNSPQDQNFKIRTITTTKSTTGRWEFSEVCPITFYLQES